MTRCLRPSRHKTPRARASDRSSVHDPCIHDPVLTSFQLSHPLFKEGKLEWVLPPACTRKYRARASVGSRRSDVYHLPGKLAVQNGKALIVVRRISALGQELRTRHSTFFRRPLTSSAHCRLSIYCWWRNSGGMAMCHSRPGIDPVEVQLLCCPH